jgi:hypothetical protein
LIIMHDPIRQFVVEVLRGDSSDVKASLQALGASIWLRVANTSGDMHRYIAVWTMQGPTHPPPLSDLVASANAALQRLPKNVCPAAGVVLQAVPVPSVPVRREKTGRVLGLSFGPGEGQLAQGLSLLREELSALIGEAL